VGGADIGRHRGHGRRFVADRAGCLQRSLTHRLHREKLHELELPSALEGVKSAEELHQALKAHLKKTSSKERAPTKKR
jgi:hypothetical protein